MYQLQISVAGAIMILIDAAEEYRVEISMVDVSVVPLVLIMGHPSVAAEDRAMHLCFRVAECGIEMRVGINRVPLRLYLSWL